MATLAEVKVEPSRVDSKASESSRGTPKSPSKTRGSLLRHKSRSQAESVRESERSLHQLLEDFEEGKLNAFGKYRQAKEVY